MKTLVIVGLLVVAALAVPQEPIPFPVIDVLAEDPLAPRIPTAWVETGDPEAGADAGLAGGAAAVSAEGIAAEGAAGGAAGWFAGGAAGWDASVLAVPVDAAQQPEAAPVEGAVEGPHGVPVVLPEGVTFGPDGPTDEDEERFGFWGGMMGWGWGWGR